MAMKNALLVIFTVALCMAGCNAAHGDTSRRLLRETDGLFSHVNLVAGNFRSLLQGGGGNGGRGWQADINTLRSELATADAIHRAVNSGANPAAVKRAAGVGVTTVFANAQGSQSLFDFVEYTARNGRRLLQEGPPGTSNLRSEMATADAIHRAVDSGASLGATRAAAGVGDQTVFANAQGSSGVFDQVEYTNRNGKK